MLRLVSRHSKTLPATNTPIELAVGKVISAGISSPVNLPPFHQSAMDGYAFRFLDFQKKISLNIVAEVAAGYTHTEKLKKGQAVRIFTGASLPEGADTVVIQERAKTNGRQLIIEDIEIEKGECEAARVAGKKRTNCASKKHPHQSRGSWVFGGNGYCQHSDNFNTKNLSDYYWQ